MHKLCSSIPFEGMTSDKSKCDMSYKSEMNYIEVNYLHEDSFYVTVYLRPYHRDKTLITAFVPQLRYIEDIRYDEELAGSLSFSQETLAVLYQRGANKSFFVSYEKDITGESQYSSFPCVHKVIDMPLSAKIFNPDFHEYKVFKSKVQDIINFANNFVNDLRLQTFDFDNAQWVKKVSKSKIKAVIEEGERSGFWGEFMNNVCNVHDETLKQVLIHNKVVLVCERVLYSGEQINDWVFHHDAVIMVLAEVFDASLKGSGYMFVIDVESRYGNWYARTHVGELIGCVSSVLNNVHSKKWAGIDISAYNKMPKTTDIWFYSNPYHHGVMLDSYISENDRIDRGANGSSFIVDEPDYLKDKYSLDNNNFWSELNFCYYISNIIETTLTVILEFEGYYPLWKKKQILSIFADSAKVLSNPSKYWIKKKIDNNNFKK